MNHPRAALYHIICQSSSTEKGNKDFSYFSSSFVSTVASLEELHRFRLNSSGIGFAEMQAKESWPGRKSWKPLLFTADFRVHSFSKLCFSVAFAFPTKICYLYLTFTFVSLINTCLARVLQRLWVTSFASAI